MKPLGANVDLLESAANAAVSEFGFGRSCKRVSQLVALALLCCIGPEIGRAQFTILHDFGDGTAPTDGLRPEGLILGPDGIFYGATSKQIGTPFEGTVYRMTPDGSIQIIQSFTAGLISPRSPLIYYRGKLVGVAGEQEGAENIAGAVFRTKLLGGTKTWHVFDGSVDGSDPNGLILGSDGDLYGTAIAGGANDQGTIFKLSPTAPHTFTVLYTFNPATDLGVAPFAPLLLAADGNYYGTTAFMGTAIGATIFQMTPAGKVTFVAKFDRATIFAPLIQDKDGNFYGVTNESVFKMTPSFAVSTLHEFGLPAKDGLYPFGGLVLHPNGNLYGTTSGGGSRDHGTIFRLGTDGSGFTTLHRFTAGHTVDGHAPDQALVVGPDNNLYGTTPFGGSKGFGIVFRISP